KALPDMVSPITRQIDGDPCGLRIVARGELLHSEERAVVIDIGRVRPPFWIETTDFRCREDRGSITGARVLARTTAHGKGRETSGDGYTVPFNSVRYVRFYVSSLRKNDVGLDRDIRRNGIVARRQVNCLPRRQ